MSFVNIVMFICGVWWAWMTGGTRGAVTVLLNIRLRLIEQEQADIVLGGALGAEGDARRHGNVPADPSFFCSKSG